MSVFDEYNPHTILNFSEVNIINGNRMFREKSEFLEHLSDIQANTTDSILLCELRGLIEKINRLTDREFEMLLDDAETGALLFPPNYVLPITSESMGD